MASSSSRSAEIQICNNTKNITLRKPRTYFNCARCSKGPRPVLPPGSSDTCSFFGNLKFWCRVATTEVSGILVYEAESFTLAIYFYKHSHQEHFPMRLGLELSPGKAHLGDLEATHSRMAGGTYSSSDQDIKSDCVVLVAGSHGTAQVSHGPVKVMATMSKTKSSMIQVVLEEEEGSGEED